MDKGAATRTILIVEDSTIDRMLLTRIFSNEYRLLEASDGIEALEMLRSEPLIDMVLSDIHMPRMNGYELLKSMSDDDRLSRIPVIIVTAGGDNKAQNEAFKYGAVDIIAKPYEPELVRHRVSNLLGVLSHREADNLAERDVLQRQVVRHQAYDEMTGLYHRYGFYRHARACLDANTDIDYIVVRADIDRFKAYNDTFGMQAGDKLLEALGKALYRMGDEHMVFGRLDADHFVALLPAERLKSDRLIERLNEWLLRYPTDFHLTASYGIYEVVNRDVDISLMCDRALMALRTVKSNYTHKVAVYDDALRLKLLDEQTLTGEMDAALSDGQFLVYFQPQVNYAEGKLTGAEALVRWKHPTRGLIPPNSFIPLFEKNGFITKLDEYVWDKACAHMRKWRDMDGELPEISVSVNISRVDIYNPRLGERLIDIVTRHGLKPCDLRLEISESIYIEDSRRLVEAVIGLKRMGFSVEMDDFGSGYSSLNMLKDVPVDVLKLDTRFLSAAQDEQKSGTILNSIIRMAHWLGLPVIPEGVETETQADYLKNLGAYCMQGYFFGRPMPAEDFEIFMRGMKPGKNDYFRKSFVHGGESFWDSTAQNALLFNSYVGCAAIVEYHDGNLEALQVNDAFYRMVDATRDEFFANRLHLQLRMTDASAAECLRKVEALKETGGEMDCEVKCKPKREGERCHWYMLRARLLAISGDRALYYTTLEDITERKELTARLTRTLSSMPGGLISFIKRGSALMRVDYISDGCCRMIGRSKEELKRILDSNLMGMVHPDDAEGYLEVARTAISLNKPFSYQYRIMKGDGNWMWLNCECISTSMRDEDDDTEGVHIYLAYTDITRLKRMEAQLVASSEELENVLSSIPGGIMTYRVSPEGRMTAVYCSEGVAELCGAMPEVFREQLKTETGIYPKDEADVEKAVQAACATGKEVNICCRLLHADGSPVWVSLWGRVLKNERGVVMFHAVFHSLSDRMSLYQSILDESDDAIIVSDEASRELYYINRAAAALAGKPFRRPQGERCCDYLFGEAGCHENCAVCQYGSDGEFTANGRRYRTRSKRIDWNGRDAVVNTITEITSR